jgi:hypothetical protein
MAIPARPQGRVRCRIASSSVLIPSIQIHVGESARARRRRAADGVGRGRRRPGGGPPAPLRPLARRPSTALRPPWTRLRAAQDWLLCDDAELPADGACGTGGYRVDTSPRLIDVREDGHLK